VAISPTDVVIPTATETARPTSTETPQPSSTAVLPTDIPQEIIETVIAASPQEPVLTLVSNDGAWAAEQRTAFNIDVGADEIFYYAQLKVVSLDGAEEWVIAEETDISALGLTVPTPLMWAQDSPFLYYTNKPLVDGCGLFFNATDLHLFDAEDGSTIDMLPPGTYSLAVSWDSANIAYVTNIPELVLIVMDWFTGLPRMALLDGDQAGAVVWSPDSTRLALTIAKSPCMPTDWEHAIAIVDVPWVDEDYQCNADPYDCLEEMVVVAFDDRRLTTVAWPEPGRILLRDQDGQEVWLDITE
jgi:hypothetical protein